MRKRRIVLGPGKAAGDDTLELMEARGSKGGASAGLAAAGAECATEVRGL